MNKVRDQYEAYPYPERDPRDEKKRLILGSPSLPQEIDHYVFGGQRDWSQPLRIFVAGGGTGDGLIQLTALLTQYGKPYQATYIDLSAASRKVAEARARTRGLKNITFVTGSLLDAPDHGPFDYIDCCGVLHHLPDPDAGFTALRQALAPGGGIGFMVYAPYGRSGVYPLQEAFTALYEDMSPKDRLKAARQVVERLPAGHPFKSNTNLNDHKSGDAGFYDLLLHSTDRAYDVQSLTDTLDRTGWSFAGFTVPILYDLARLAPVPAGMDPVAAMAVAEKLNGTIRTHTGYATDTPRPVASGKTRTLVPHIKGLHAAQLARAVAQGQTPALDTDGIRDALSLPRQTAPLLAAIDGRRSLQEIAGHAGMDPITFGGHWSQVEKALLPWGMLVYSNVLR
ncbi:MULTISPECIES: class I SAM-dependent methyltransferase [unclassified Roseovarius]|uniref:class I SAM-dependent methyltransferase n=1 Tax=unclassified Roseovarius TaxID=2614913 RepID=UPI00273EA51E|nr:class I SAM-dependent methyltransferase [Roseovarius sp. MMSF_3350]